MNQTEQATYEVQGMTCGGCAASVTRAIQRVIPGVEVDVQLAGGHVTVKGAHDEALVREAVEGAGFDFAGRQA